MITKQYLAGMKRGVLGACLVLGVWSAIAAPSVEITNLSREDPDSGVVSCSYTVKDIPSFAKYDLLIKVGAKGCSTSVVITNANVANGTVTTSVNCKQLLGKNYLNVTFRASLLDGVQLWANGPYFATCNVGASSPEECGYYFWWGDTVGYRRNASNNGWVSSADGTTAIRFIETDPTAGQTYNKTPQQLVDAGFSDDASTGILNAAHDAATAHLGAPWRMPTKAELDKLVDPSVCEWEWKDSWEGTGKAGWIVRGKGTYTSNSVFLPAVGSGFEKFFFEPTDDGCYRTSTPDSNSSTSVWYLNFYSGEYSVETEEFRCDGFVVRPVRD